MEGVWSALFMYLSKDLPTDLTGEAVRRPDSLIDHRKLV